MYSSAPSVATASAAAERLAEAKRRFTQGVLCGQDKDRAMARTNDAAVADGVVPRASLSTARASSTQAELVISAASNLPPAAPYVARERDSRATTSRDAVQIAHDSLRSNGDTPLPPATVVSANCRPGSERSRLSATPNSCIIDNLSGILPPNSQNTVNVLHSPLETVVPPMLSTATYGNDNSGATGARVIAATAARTLLPSRHSSAAHVVDSTRLGRRARPAPGEARTSGSCKWMPTHYRATAREPHTRHDAVPRTRRVGLRRAGPRREGLLQLLQSYRACLDAVARFNLTAVTSTEPLVAGKPFAQDWPVEQASVKEDKTQRPSMPPFADPYAQAVRNALALLARLEVYRHSCRNDAGPASLAHDAAGGSAVTPPAPMQPSDALCSSAVMKRRCERRDDDVAEASLRAARERAEQMLYYNTIARTSAGLQRLDTARQFYLSMLCDPHKATLQRRTADLDRAARGSKVIAPSPSAVTPAPETRAQALPLPLTPTSTACDGGGEGGNTGGSRGGEPEDAVVEQVVRTRLDVGGAVKRCETQTSSALLSGNRTLHTLPYHSNNSSVTTASTVTERAGAVVGPEGRQGDAVRATFTAVPPTPLRVEAVAAPGATTVSSDDAVTPNVTPQLSLPSSVKETTSEEEQRAWRLLTRVRSLRRQTEDMTVALLHTCGAWECWKDEDVSCAAPSSPVSGRVGRRGMAALRALFTDLFVKTPPHMALRNSAEAAAPLTRLPAAPPLSTQLELFARFNETLRHDMLQAVARHSFSSCASYAAEARLTGSHDAAQDWPFALPCSADVTCSTRRGTNELYVRHGDNLAWHGGRALRRLCATRHGNTAAARDAKAQTMAPSLDKRVAEITRQGDSNDNDNSSSNGIASSTDTSYGEASYTYDGDSHLSDSCSNEPNNSSSTTHSEPIVPAMKEGRASALQKACWPLRAAATWQPLMHEMATTQPGLTEQAGELRLIEDVKVTQRATLTSASTPHAYNDTEAVNEPALLQQQQQPRRHRQSVSATRRRRSTGDATRPAMYHPMQMEVLSPHATVTASAQGEASRRASLSSRQLAPSGERATGTTTASEPAVRYHHRHHHRDGAAAVSAPIAMPDPPILVQRAEEDMTESAVTQPSDNTSMTVASSVADPVTPHATAIAVAVTPPSLIPLQSTEMRGPKRGMFARFFHPHRGSRTSPHPTATTPSRKRRRNPLATLFSCTSRS